MIRTHTAYSKESVVFLSHLEQISPPSFNPQWGEYRLVFCLDLMLSKPPTCAAHSSCASEHFRAPIDRFQWDLTALYYHSRRLESEANLS